MSSKKVSKRLEQLPHLRKEEKYLSKAKNHEALQKVLAETKELEAYIVTIQLKNAYAYKLAKQAYIEGMAGVFATASDAKIKQRYIKHPPRSSLYNAQKVSIAKRKLLPIFEQQKAINSKKLNLPIEATPKQIEAYILELDDSFSRLALRYYLIDKKTNAQMISQDNSSPLKKLNAYLKEQ